jgi:hypothetical protein
MRFSSLLLVSALVLVTTAASADDPMATTYGNTVTAKDTKTGAVAAFLFNADGTYTESATGADGKAVTLAGKWVTKDNGATLCLSPQVPANTPNAPGESCSPLAIHAIGEHWPVTNSMGASFDVVLTAGR